MPRLAALLAAGIAFTSVFARQTGLPKADTMWAEDGQIFLSCLSRGDSPVWCLGEAYGGYLHVLPRLAANVAWLAPPDRWSVAVTVAAALVLALAAWLVAQAVKAVTGSWLAGLISGASLGLTFEAGREIAGNLANLHWVLFVAVMTIVATAWLEREPRRTDLAFVALAGLSSPLMAIPAAVAVAGWLRRRPGFGSLASTTIGALLVQLGVEFSRPRDPPLHAPVGILDAVVAYGREVLLDGPFGPGLEPLGLALVAVVAIVLLALLRVSGTESRRALVAMAALAGSGATAYVIAVVTNRWVGPRYGYVAATLWIIAAIVGAALLARNGQPASEPKRSSLRGAAPPALAAILAVGAIASYRLASRTSGGPSYAEEYEMSIARCGSGAASVHVPIAPRPSPWSWSVEVPCDRIGRPR